MGVVGVWKASGRNVYKILVRKLEIKMVQGGSNMTGTNCGFFTHRSVPVIFESPCIQPPLFCNMT
jgi:hypothetical protein